MKDNLGSVVEHSGSVNFSGRNPRAQLLGLIRVENSVGSGLRCVHLLPLRSTKASKLRKVDYGTTRVRFKDNVS